MNDLETQVIDSLNSETLDLEEEIVDLEEEIVELEDEIKKLTCKLDIWKDPKVELPENSNIVVIKMLKYDRLVLDFRYDGDTFMHSNGDREFKIEHVEKWCDITDLIKQAKGE